ncbi:MAG: serine hydrolase domain-containing protein [Nocardioidaceae bacterium]
MGGRARSLNRRTRLRALGAATIAVVCLPVGCSGDDPTAAPASTTTPTPADPTIEQFLDDTLPAGSSGTVLVARGDEIVHCTGFGMADREERVPASCDTVYDIQSITKQFTAAAILKLEMMGRLRVCDPISRYVEPVPKDKRGITIHHLLTHTAGLREALGGDYEPQTREAMLEGALSSRLRSTPGSRYAYSNVGYSVLAVIVEEASGMDYEEFLAENLFEPAGMTETGYVRPEWSPRSVAVEYDRHGQPKGRPFDHPWADDGPYWNLRGNGGILTTARDMFRWHLALQGDEVLSPQAKQKLFTPYVVEGPGATTHYGYGWVVVDSRPYGKVVWHDGGNGWSLSMVTRFLDEDVLVFWTSNHAYQQGQWNLETSMQKLTLGLAEGALD